MVETQSVDHVSSQTMVQEKVILLAEDDPQHVALFKVAVRKSGMACRVDVVCDGAEAIDYLFGVGQYKDRDTREMPNLILLDLKMPKIDGIQVLQILRRVRSDDSLRFPPVVVLTSSDLDDDITEAYRLGAQSYIRKPLSYEEFTSAVRETLQYWLGLNRAAPAHRHSSYHMHERL